MSRSKRNAAAEEYFRRAPNYSAEAVGDLRKEDASSKYGGACHALADEIEASTKFALPFGAHLFERTTDVMMEQWKPPYPLTSFEFDTVWADGLPLRVVATVNDGDCSCGCGSPDEFRLAWLLSAPNSRWKMVPYWWRVEKERGAKFYDLRTARIIEDSIGAASGGKSDERVHLVVHMLSNLAQVFAALSCTNVTTEVIRPNREARAARPGSTLFDYHVLMVDPCKVSERGEDLGGSHASPRTHLRRGHIRRHPTAGRIWVNSCVVNPMAIGTVNKDYRVKP